MMTIPLSQLRALPIRHTLGLSCVLVVAGFAGNYFSYPVFLNIDFLFGSIFSLLAVQFFGLVPSVVTAALVSSCTYLLWNHPYAIIIMTAEVAVVGWLNHRRQIDVVLADVLFWLCVGMPLVYLLYGAVMGAWSSVFITMIKQATNGITNALIARLLFTAMMFNVRGMVFPLREIMANLLMVFVLFPSLIQMMADSRADFALTDQRVKDLLIQDSRRMTCHMQRWLADRHDLPGNLAGPEAVPVIAQRLAPILSLLMPDLRDGVLLTLTDQDTRVIMSNRPDQIIGQPFARGTGRGEATGHGIVQWVPKIEKNIPISERWQKSYYVLESTIEESPGWKFLLEQPVAPFQKQIYARYTEKLTLLFFVLLGALGCAELVSRRLMKTNEVLVDLTRNVVPRLIENTATLDWPVSSLKETSLLIENFKAMAEELHAQFTATCQARELLEERVVERTLALQESRDLFRTLAAHAPVGIFLTDDLGRCTYVNAKWCELTGLTEQQAMGNGWAAALHPDDRAMVLDRWHDRVHNNGEFALEYRFLSPRGATRWVYGIATYLPAPRAEAGQYIGSVVDISERKYADAALQESETNFRSLVESIDDLIVVARYDGHVLFANQAFERKLGYSVAEQAGMHMLDLHPADRRGEAEAIFAAMLRGEVEFCPLPIVSSSGKRIPVWTRAWAGSWNGSPCIFGFIKDLTAEQEAQQLFELIFRNNPTLMALNSLPDRHFVDVNTVFLQTLGYAREEVIGATPCTAGMMPLQEQEDELTERLLAEGRIATYELSLRCRDGRMLVGLLSSEVIHTQRGDLVLSVFIDITERKRVVEEIQRSREAAVAADAAKSRLLATIAHEFRTPLSLLGSSLDILDRYGERLSGHQLQEQEASIRRASRQMKALVDSIVSYSQSEAPARHQGDRLADLESLVQEICQDMRSAWQDSRDFQLTLEAGCGGLLVPERLFWRVLHHLLHNAFQYTDPGQRVSLHITRSACWLVMEIADQGIGIPAEDQEHVFATFYRGSNVGERRGVGLGLDIVNDALRQLKGTICLSSAIGEGTTVVVRLPWRAPEADPGLPCKQQNRKEARHG